MWSHVVLLAQQAGHHKLTRGGRRNLLLNMASQYGVTRSLVAGERRALVWVGEQALLVVAAPLPHESACGLGDSVVILSLKWMVSPWLAKGTAAWADVQGTPT